MSKMALTPNVPQYWEKLYEEGKDDWDIGKATPALLEFFKHPSCPRKGDVLVPAAGRGWDAEAWAKRGHNVLAVDFCPTAVDAMERLAENSDKLNIVNMDMFLMNPRDVKSGAKKFDIIYDYFGFNSVHPGRRDECVEMWFKMLKDDGILIGFFCPLCDEKYGEFPPFSISKEELETRFEGLFEIKKRIVPKKSVKSRSGKEEIWLLEKIK
jgi:hypothetical protein